MVGTVFDQQFRESAGRVLITTFASNLHRVQQVFADAYADTAARGWHRNHEGIPR